MTFRHEIVRVLNETSLIDSESYQRRYWTRDGQPLGAGHYVVLWDESVEAPAFDEGATYVGPYKSSLLAAATLQSLLRSPAAPGPAPEEHAPPLRAAA